MFPSAEGLGELQQKILQELILRSLVASPRLWYILYLPTLHLVDFCGTVDVSKYTIHQAFGFVLAENYLA